MSYFVYILRGSSNQLYIGQTNNLPVREKQHATQNLKAAKFTKDGKGFKLIYSEQYNTRKEAMRRESQLKEWSRSKKEALISGDLARLKELSKRRK